MESKNSHIVKEGEYDFNGIKRRNLFNFFKLPVLAAVLIIAVFLSFKYGFSGINAVKRSGTINSGAAGTVIKNVKRFSSSVFNVKTNVSGSPGYSGLKKVADIQRPGRIKKKPENGLKFHSEYLKYGFNSSRSGITGDTVVYVEQAYQRKVESEEDGTIPGSSRKQVKPAGSPAGYQKISGGPYVPVGTVLDACTIYKIFSYNTEVPVLAVLTHDYTRSGIITLRRGDIVYGMAGTVHSLDRINIRFDKIIGLDGRSENIEAIAMMPDGSGGIKGSVDNHDTGNVMASLAGGIVSAASMFAGGGSALNSSNPYTFQNQLRENISESGLNSAKNALGSYSRSITNSTITVPADTPIKIIFLKSFYVNGINGLKG